MGINLPPFYALSLHILLSYNTTMETLEDIYASMFRQHEETLLAANPYGCNQYGHRKGHQGSSSPKEENEIDKYWKLPTINARKEQFEKWRNEARQAKKALDTFTRLTYRPAYVKTHGMDQEPTQEDWRAFENADNERRRLEYEANQAEKKFEERKNKIANYWEKSPRLLYNDAVNLTDDIFEIALEEGGYEKLYDTPKDKLKHAITQELMESGTKDMFGNIDTGESGTPAKYKWWRKNIKKVLARL